MIYLKEFATQAAYDAASTNLPTPNVSLITEGGEVKYKGGPSPVPPTPTNATVTCVFDVDEDDSAIEFYDEAFINGVSSMTFDGRPIDVTSAITSVDAGEHTVVFTLQENSNITYYAFGDNPYLKTVNIQGDGDTTIEDGGGGNGAFYFCPKLESAVIGNGVTSIGESAFDDCTALTSVTIGNDVTSIGDGAFAACGFASITIPNSVTNIGSSVFSSCDALTSVTIGNGVTSIGENAFFSCNALTSIVIPDGVTSIGENAFNDCDGLTSITCLATTPPTLGDYAFDGTNSCTIYVPSVSAYKSASGWSKYASRIQAIP